MTDSWLWPENPPAGKLNVNPMTTPFRQIDLDQSTFSLDFPSFDRGLSTSSIPFNAPFESNEPIFAQAGVAANNSNAAQIDYSSIPAPFAPIRSFSGASVLAEFTQSQYEVSDHFLPAANSQPANFNQNDQNNFNSNENSIPSPILFYSRGHPLSLPSDSSNISSLFSTDSNIGGTPGFIRFSPKISGTSGLFIAKFTKLPTKE